MSSNLPSFSACIYYHLCITSSANLDWMVMILSHYVTELFLKLCAISTLISRLINRSLAFGTVPLELKTAADTLILRKLCLGPPVLNNYRPITNLCWTELLPLSNHTKCLTFCTSLTRQNIVILCTVAGTVLCRAIIDLLLSAESGVLNIQLLLDLKSLLDSVI